jgi:hypothetical protein
MTPADFRAVVLAQPTGLASAVTLDVRARAVTVRTRDAHAAHAVEHLARRRGLRVLVTRPDDDSFVLGLRGFTRPDDYHGSREPTETEVDGYSPEGESAK